MCDTVTKLANASEPEKCQYRIELHSPLVCLQHVMKGKTRNLPSVE